MAPLTAGGGGSISSEVAADKDRSAAVSDHEQVQKSGRTTLRPLCKAGCGRARAPRRPYCSTPCRPSAKKSGLFARTRELVCALGGCGVSFTTRKPNRLYCTPAHTARAGGDRSGRGAGRKFPRVRYAARQAIFERDGWRCPLCGAPVDPELRFPHPGSATIDHRDPDGAHDPTNWQTAHLGCNVSKGRKVAIGADPKLSRAES